MFAIDAVCKDSLDHWLNTVGNYYIGNPHAFGTIIGDGFLSNPFEVTEGKCIYVRAPSYFNCDYEDLHLHHAYLLYISRHPAYLRGVINRLLELWKAEIRRFGCECNENNCHAFILNEIFLLFSRVEAEILARLLNRFGHVRFDVRPLQIIHDTQSIKSEYLFNGREGEIWNFTIDSIDGSAIKDTISSILREYAEERMSFMLSCAGCALNGEEVEEEGRQGTTAFFCGSPVTFVRIVCKKAIVFFFICKKKWFPQPENLFLSELQYFAFFSF